MPVFLKVKTFYLQYKQEIHFISKVFLIYLATRAFFFVMGREIIPIQDRFFPAVSSGWELFNDWARLVLLHGTSFLLSILGHTSVVSHDSVTSIGMGTLSVGNYCIGIRLWIYFAALLIAYPGKWRKKLPFIVFGILCINVLNIVRLTGLMYVSAYKPSLLEFSHEYLFNYSIYGFTLFMFYLWVTRYNN